MKKQAKFTGIIIMSAIVAYSAYIQWYNTNMGNLQERLDLIEALEQNEDILKVAASHKDKELSTFGAQSIILYTDKLEAACLKRFLYKNNCKLHDLNLKSLRSLFNALEERVQQIPKIQNSIYNKK